MKRIVFAAGAIVLLLFMLIGCDPLGQSDEITTAPPVTTATPAEEFEYHTYDDGTKVWITKYSGNATHVVVPAKIDGLPVKIVGGFYESAVESVWIPDGVEQIDMLAFAKCTALTEVKLSDSVRVLQQSAFEGCTALVTVALPPKLTGMQGDVFRDCTSLTSITIPGTLADSYENFSGCTALRTVTFAAGESNLLMPLAGTPVREIIIEGDARTMSPDFFVGCPSLESITFLGDAPNLLEEKPLCSPYFGDIPTPEDYTVTLYYPKDAQGWDGIEAHECYRLVPQ